MGVTCINLGWHREAAEHFISALETHRVDLTAYGASEGSSEDKNVSLNLWGTLGKTLLLMGRGDLAERALMRDISLFKCVLGE